MDNFVRLSFVPVLVLVFISLITVNSSPTPVSLVVAISTVVPEIKSKTFECHNDDDCGNGKCLNGTICDCLRGWIPNGNIAEKTGPCNYNQRSKRTAFLVSLFSGNFGADWFYLSRSNLAYIITGIFKLLLTCLICSISLLSYFGSEIQNLESIKSKFRSINACLGLISFAWWIVDWARILANRFPDGNGEALMPW